MNKARNILAISLLLCGLTVSAQTYESVVRENFWNASSNVTGMRQDTVSRSYAEAYGGYEGGKFRDTWQAEQGWSAGAVTASIRHMKKMSLAGSFSFEQTEGYGMCGSMFIKPGFYPVDVLEFTPGRKTLQTYAFNGGISYDIAPSWRIGGKMDFESANMAKRKDLRHTNWRLDMTVAPGFMYHNDDFAIGASYILRKTSESVKAEQVGIAESSYYAFLDKGMMYGVYSVWSGSGLHLSEAGVNGFPVRDLSHGAAIQAQYKGLFVEVEYAHTQGTIGEKEYIWFRFPGNAVKAGLGFRHEGETAEHFARLNFRWNRLGLDESILEKVSENGVTNVYYHGKNRILTKENVTLNPEYELITKKFELVAGADIEWDNSLSSQMYPYAYYESFMSWRAKAGFTFHIGKFDLKADLGFGAGKESESDETVYIGLGVETAPYRLTEWHERHIEYMTASRLDTGLAIRYNFRIGLYLEAEGGWQHGFGLKHLAGADRSGAGLKIGYNF